MTGLYCKSVMVDLTFERTSIVGARCLVLRRVEQQEGMTSPESEVRSRQSRNVASRSVVEIIT